MTERAAAERIVRELHMARVSGDLAGMCRLFADEGRFEIAGASADKPIAIRAQGLAEFKPVARDDDQGLQAERLSSDLAHRRRAAGRRALARRTSSPRSPG